MIAWRVLMVFFVITCGAVAQTSLGTVRGMVTDPSGAVVPDARIHIRNIDTGIEHSARTGQNGSYEVTHLTPGRYAVRGEAAGFNSVTSAIVLETSASVRVDLRLSVGEVTTAVEVEAVAPLINTEGSEVASVRTTRLIEQAPVNYRMGGGQGYIYMTMVLTPGVQRAQGSNFSFAGARSTQWTAALDGTDIRSTVATSQSGMDSTAELRMQLANDKAEASTAGGVYQTSKSGTNALHGTAFFYHTNPRLNARNTFSPDVPFLLHHNYGGTLGGPVIKNRTFFFVGYERLWQREDNIFNLNVPTVAMRAGDFSALPGNRVVRDPLTGQPFPSNLIPDFRISPVSRKVQERYFPLPNTGPADNYQRNWQGAFPGYPSRYQLEGRVDHQVSSSNSLFARLTWNRAPARYVEFPGFPDYERDRRGTALTISNTHIFTPALINEFRFGIGRSKNPWTSELDGLELVRQFGLQGIATNPVIAVGAPGFSITGFSSPPSAWFQDPREASTQFVNNVTLIRGAHTVKTGVDVRYNVGTNFPGGSAFLARSFGAFSFTGTFSNFAYADFLLGIPLTSRRANTAPRYHLDNRSVSAFVQDDWKITPRLTLNLGVRYDFSPPAHERNGLFFNFDPNAGRIVVPDESALLAVNPAFPSNLVSIVPASQAGLPESLFFSDQNNFTPRFGFAYRPFARSTTVIRGGYGIYTTFKMPSLYSTTVGGPFISDETFTNAIENGSPRFAFPEAYPAGFGAVGAQSFTAVDPHLRNPLLHQWNLTIEREILHTGLRISYIGSRSNHLVWGENINQPPPSMQPFSNNLRRFPALLNVVLRQNGGMHDYQSLHVVAERKMRSGLYYQLGWTWGKNITDVQSDSEGGGQPENSYARYAERSDVDYMPRHRLVGTVLYDLPFGTGRRWLASGHGLARWVLGGWTVSNVLVSQTGFYFNPTFSGFDVSNTNTLGGRPDRISDGNLPNNERTLDRWFDASAFRVPGDLTGDGRPDVAVGRFGNSGPNVLEGPGRFYISTGVFRDFSLTEKMKVTLLGMFTNVMNHPIYGNPQANISSPGDVGSIRVSADKDPQATQRNVQLALRLQF